MVLAQGRPGSLLPVLVAVGGWKFMIQQSGSGNYGNAFSARFESLGGAFGYLHACLHNGWLFASGRVWLEAVAPMIIRLSEIRLLNTLHLKIPAQLAVAAVGFGSTLLLSVGLWKWIRSGELYLTTSVIAYIALLSVWPYDVVRLALPIIPIVFGIAWAGFSELATCPAWRQRFVTLGILLLMVSTAGNVVVLRAEAPSMKEYCRLAELREIAAVVRELDPASRLETEWYVPELDLYEMTGHPLSATSAAIRQDVRFTQPVSGTGLPKEFYRLTVETPEPKFQVVGNAETRQLIKRSSGGRYELWKIELN